MVDRDRIYAVARQLIPDSFTHGDGVKINSDRYNGSLV